MKTLLFAFLLSLVLACSVSAQVNTGDQIAKALSKKAAPGDNAKTKEAKKAPPASVEFTTEQVRDATAKRDAAKMAALEAENMALKLERAQTEYQKLREGAATAQTVYVEYLRSTAEKLGIPKEELPNYEFSDAGGKFTLKRKESKSDAPANEPKTESKGGN